MIKFLTTDPPDGRRLFRVTLVASAAALLVGGLILLALWAATDFALDEGRLFARLFGMLAAILVAAVVMHYPWSRRWCEAAGCKYPD
jgi:hypothetical protein